MARWWGNVIGAQLAGQRHHCRGTLEVTALAEDVAGAVGHRVSALGVNVESLRWRGHTLKIDS